MSWTAALREIDDILDAWESFVTDPANEPMPVTDLPSFPDGPIEAELVGVARRLKARSDQLQSRLGDLRDAAAASLAELRRERSAVGAYRATSAETPGSLDG